MYPQEYDAAGAFRNHGQFTHQNWSDGGEIMHYAFLHMSQFFTHAVIHRTGPVAELAFEPRDDIAGLTVATDRGVMTLDEYVRAAPVNGIVITQGGRIVYECYPRMRSFDKHLLMSVSKIFVSTVIGILEDRGQVDACASVETYLPELAGSGWEGVSVQDALDMCSGIDCLEDDIEGAYSDPATGYYQFEASLDWLAKTGDTWDSTYDYVASLRRGWEPGEIYHYTGLNTFVLTWIAERVTGKLFAEVVTDLLWSKLGAESDALLSTSHIGAPASHGGISTTVRDLARLGLLFTPNWSVVAGERVISAALLEKIQRGGRPHIVDLTGTGQPPGLGFGDERPRHSTYQWNFVFEDGDFYKGGYGGQGLYISPSRDLIIAYTGTPGPDKESNRLRYVARQIARSGLV